MGNNNIKIIIPSEIVMKLDNLYRKAQTEEEKKLVLEKISLAIYDIEHEIINNFDDINNKKVTK